jgi:hypothetical protein
MENVKNLIRKQNRNMKHVHDFIIATGFLYMSHVTKMKSISVRTQLDSIYCIQLHVSTYLRSSSGPIFVIVTLWDENVMAMNVENTVFWDADAVESGDMLALSLPW